ncbi:addiction module protein [Massilia sp. YIM B02763]|uniref:addiction module protein n=1 Tax=Massilia sp. YIM B02763 TaxID=3050130 RepID=UPI0025B64B1D|nr:addiction module protein [Massilia sp. YIM B02763]MDN4055846.1 addiction module protein [Massilia sp. YIM B02763]
MTTVAELAAQIQQLSAADRHELLRLLLVDSDEAEQDADEAWRNEVVRRVKAIHNGEAAIRMLQDD